ncbi:MAG: hypothetical protein F6K23_06010, partial [Okeania sp. SIO2C9]|uniref:Calx-beta domain-containing protein n=1 Tax=Okeania sp. SIO2C9 TaxID=2607791 RepID=UPI0013C0F514
QDNDEAPLPNISIADAATVTEGETATFTVSLDQAATTDVTFEFSTSDEEATADADYTPNSATVTIPAGETEATISVETTDDTEIEAGDETFNVTLANANGAVIADGTAVGTIQDNDEAPVTNISIADAAPVLEGYTTNFTVSLDQPATEDVTVSYTTTDGSATQPDDYTETSGTITIPTGSTQANITVPTVLDAQQNEPDETFNVNLSNPITGAIANNTATGTIQENNGVELPDLLISELDADSPAFTGQEAQFTYKVENQGLATLEDTWVDKIYLSTDEQLDAEDELLSEFEISANIQVGQFYERNVTYFNPRSPGNYYLIAAVDADEIVAEGQEANNTVIAPFEVLPAYSATVTTDVEVGVTGESILLEGTARSNEDNSPIPFEFVSIEIENNGFTRELDGFTDANGNFVREFTPLPGEAGTFNIRAFFPDNEGEDTGFEDSFNVLGATFNEEEVTHKIFADTPFTAEISLENLTDTPLTGFTSNVVDAPESWDIEVQVPDTLAGDATNNISYTITAPNESQITEDTFEIQLTSAEGATATLPVNVDLERNVPRLVTDVSTISSGMLRGEQTFVEVELTNEGGAIAENIDVIAPEAPWLSATTDTIESLAPGESTNVTLILSPDAELELTQYEGNVFFDAAGSDGDLSVPFEFRAVSDAIGSLQVNVVNELFYFTESAPKLNGAEVTLRDYFTGDELGKVTTDETGMVNFDDLPEGFYTLEVKADDHSSFSETIQIDAGENEIVNSFLSRETVKYTWNVTETEIEDVYDISVESVFETDVPIPTVVVEPPVIDLEDLQVVGQVKQIDMTFTNHGLIAANDLGMNFGEHPFYKIEPLIDEIGSLDAKSSITVPVRITRIADFDTLEQSSSQEDNGIVNRSSIQLRSASASSSSVSCGISGSFDYSYICGDRQVGRSASIAFNGVDGNSGCGISAGGSGSGSSSGSGRINGAPVTVSSSNCDPCVEQNQQQLPDAILAVGSCIPGPIGIAFTTVGCVRALSDGEATIVDLVGCTPTQVGCAVSVLNSLSGFCSDNLLQGSSVQRSSDTLRFAANASATGTVSGALDKLSEHIERWQAIIDNYLLYFGDSIWLEIEDEESYNNWVNSFEQKIQGQGDARKITDQERNELLNTPFPEPLTGSDINKFIDRWNRTIDYGKEGILNVADVPEGQSTDFITLEDIERVENALNTSLEQTQAEGFNDLREATLAKLEELEEALDNDNDGVCAKVRIEIDQEAVLTRSAFLGELVIENSSEVISLENIDIDLEVLDENGNVVNELFGITDPILENISAVDGSGILGTDSTGSAEWTFIPTNLAAQETPEEYSIGGSLSYLQDGELVTVPLVSTPITVYPQAELTVDYFQQRNVFGDDPFTDATEISEPFSLGVLVSNEGFGAAQDLSITSSQPQIIENEKGLLIDFEIIGSQVNGNPASPSLTVDFGNIEPGETAVADWLLKSSLQGKFIEYEATFEHVNGLGNPELSLIKEVNIHELIQKVKADSDGLPDFLVNGEFDANFYPDILHFSDGTTAPVTAIDDVTVDAPVTISDLEAEITIAATEGWTYINLEDPANGQFNIEKIMRSDGTEIDPDNYWRTDRTFPATGQPIYENILHILDLDSSGNYTIIYDSDDSAPPEVQQIIDVDPNPRNTPVPDIQVIFTEPIAADTFDDQDIQLTLDDGNNLITDAVSVTQIDPITFQINNLSGITGNVGQYRLAVDSTGIEDLSGNTGAGTVTENWVFTGDRPAVATIEGFTSNLLTTPVDTFTVTFTEAIVAGSFDYQDITLTRNDGGNLINDKVTVTKIDDLTYEVANIANLSNTEGEYELIVAANNVQDIDGNNGVGGKGFTWELDNNVPTLTGIDEITNVRNIAIPSITVTFDQAIAPETFSWEDITLTVDGGENLITENIEIEEQEIEEQEEQDEQDETTYVIKGLIPLQTEDGEYTLTVNGSGITDNAGNSITDNLSTSWELDTIAPLAATNILVNGSSNNPSDSTQDETDYGEFSITSNNITIAGDLPEENLQVSFTDITTGDSLGQATVTGTNFTGNIELSGVGSRTVEIAIADRAENSTTGTLELFADVTLPTILEFSNVPETLTTDPVEFIDVRFSEAIDITTFDNNDITLTRDGETVSTDGITIENISDATYRIQGLTDLTTTFGNYSLGINTTTIQDQAGNSGTDTEFANFIIDEIVTIPPDVTAPTILEFSNVPETLTTDPVEFIDVRFSEAIDITTFDNNDITLTRDGETVSTDGITIENISDATYRIQGLTDLTTTFGNYSLGINTTTIQDQAGNSGTDTEFANFIIDEIVTIPP